MSPWLAALRALPWILGLALLLAAASDALHSRDPGHGFRAQLAHGGHATAIDLGLALFTLGLLISADRWWERVIWAAFLAFYIASLICRAKTPSPLGGEGWGEGCRGGPPCPPTREGVDSPSPLGGEGRGEGSPPLSYPLLRSL